MPRFITSTLRAFLPLLTLLLLSAFTPPAPMPPEVIINEETRQYAVVNRGDECVSCEPPQGWVMLGRYGQVEIPEGFSETEVDMVCTRSRAARCCLPGHSGAAGNCTGFWLTLALAVLCPLLLVAGLVVLIIGLVRRRKRKAGSSKEQKPA